MVRFSLVGAGHYLLLLWHKCQNVTLVSKRADVESICWVVLNGIEHWANIPNSVLTMEEKSLRKQPEMVESRVCPCGDVGIGKMISKNRKHFSFSKVQPTIYLFSLCCPLTTVLLLLVDNMFDQMLSWQTRAVTSTLSLEFNSLVCIWTKAMRNFGAMALVKPKLLNN